MFYAESTRGFYTPEIHGNNMPEDAVEITKEEHAALLATQAEGKTIQADDQGRPFAAFRTYTLGETRSNKLAALAAYRYERETAGITIGGATIRTDRESQAMVSGATIFSDANPVALIDWKGATGWVQIDRATLLAIGQAVGSYVQACFSLERVHAEAIGALETVAEIEAYDFTAGWPA